MLFRSLIFDEPFTGFDPINANLIKQEILELRDKGATIIFSTHNMGTVEDLCDHIALINKSKKILDGTVTTIKDTFKPNTFEITYKGDFETVRNLLGEKFAVIDHEENETENHVRIRHTNGYHGNELIGLLLHAVEIRSFREEIPSMNDIFIRVVESYNEETK